jgi:hypothetical protein
LLQNSSLTAQIGLKTLCIEQLAHLGAERGPQIRNNADDAVTDEVDEIAGVEEQKRLEKICGLILDVLLLAVDARHSLRAIYDALLPMIFQFVQRVFAMNKEYLSKIGKEIGERFFHNVHCMKLYLVILCCHLVVQLLLKSLSYLKFVVIRDDPIESLRVTLDSIIELISIGERVDNSIKVFFDINVCAAYLSIP